MVRHLYAIRAVDASVDQVLDVIRGNTPKGAPEQFIRQLRVQVARLSLERDIRFTIGPSRELDALTVGLDLRFCDAEHPDLFPTFEGRIDLRRLSDHPVRTEVIVAGSYRPPLGVVGAVGDSMGVGRALGPATTEALIDDLVQAVEAASSTAGQVLPA